MASTGWNLRTLTFDSAMLLPPPSMVAYAGMASILITTKRGKLALLKPQRYGVCVQNHKIPTSNAQEYMMMVMKAVMDGLIRGNWATFRIPERDRSHRTEHGKDKSLKEVLNEDGIGTEPRSQYHRRNRLFRYAIGISQTNREGHGSSWRIWEMNCYNFRGQLGPRI